MDDHTYEFIRDYIFMDIETTYNEMVQQNKTLSETSLYSKLVDTCKVLNIMKKYAGYEDDHWTPKTMIEYYMAKNNIV